MKQNIIQESYEWSIAKKQNRDGSTSLIAFIDPNLSTDSSFDVKEKIKEYGGRWDSINRRWYFTLSNDPEKRKTQIEYYIKPCVEYLKNNEKTPGNSTADEQVTSLIAQIDEVLNVINTGEIAQSAPQTAKNLEQKLLAYKQELIDSFKDASFREKMGPIIRYRRAQGNSYSILNTILIMLQRKDATMVKSASKWRDAEHEVKAGAKPIWMWVPKGMRAYTAEEQKKLMEKFFAKASRTYGRTVTSMSQLYVGDRERLKNLLNKKIPTSYELMPRFYDISDTVHVGKGEDPIGSLNGFDDVEWYDSHSPEDEKSAQLYDSVIEAITNEFGLKVEFLPLDQLGGARGYTGHGVITLPKGEPKTPGNVSTIIHELAHNLLHQTYLKGRKGKNGEDYGSYFVGREDGLGIVEQQAEITAWVVMKNLGYDINAAKNYVACWGGDENTAAYVFDTISDAATAIVKAISKESIGINESLLKEGINITGMDVASMLGPEAVEAYKKAKAKTVKNDFDSMMKRIDESDWRKRF